MQPEREISRVPHERSDSPIDIGGDRRFGLHLLIAAASVMAVCGLAAYWGAVASKGTRTFEVAQPTAPAGTLLRNGGIQLAPDGPLKPDSWLYRPDGRA